MAQCTNAKAGFQYSGFHRNANQCPTKACAGAPIGKYLNDAAGSGKCGHAYCVNARPAGYYFSSNGGTNSKGCATKKCSSAKADEKYKATSCPSCTSAVAESARCVKTSCGSPPVGKYFSTSGTGACTVADCTGAPTGFGCRFCSVTY